MENMFSKHSGMPDSRLPTAASPVQAKSASTLADNRETTSARGTLAQLVQKSPSATQLATRSKSANDGPKARTQAATAQLLNNGPRARSQAETLRQLNSTNRAPAQLLRAGVIPAAPDTYRTTTRVVANNSFAAIDGHKSFNNSQTQAIRDNNQARSHNPGIANENHPLRDDEDNGGLLSQARASNIAPEVDHIVPKKDNGANDIRNGRVLSKSNNINSTNRPDEGARRIAVYEDVTINQTPYVAGATLSTVDANKVKTVYGNSSLKGAVHSMDKKSARLLRRETT